MDLNGKTALVTGAARRVGRVIALELARRGMDVFVHYHRSAEDAGQTAEAIRALGVRADTVSADLADPAAIERLFAALRERFGRIDLLVNSASAFQARDVLEVSAEDWDAVMDVNLRAPFLCSQQAARLMGETGTGGVIINIADIAGQVPWPRFPHHSVSKAGLIMLTKVLAKALGPAIRVNAVVPGPVLKPEAMTDERWAELGSVLPLARTGLPEHVAQAVIALAENDFISGSVLNVDGGDGLIGSVDVI